MKAHCSRGCQKGVGLMEVLISLLVLAIGILAVVSLQAKALKNNQGSLERTQAVVLSYAMLDALRINRSEALNGSYNMNKTCDPPSGNSLVNKDQAFWVNALKQGLGNAASTCGEINCRLNTGACKIRVYWKDARGEARVVETITTI